MYNTTDMMNNIEMNIEPEGVIVVVDAVYVEPGAPTVPVVVQAPLTANPLSVTSDAIDGLAPTVYVLLK